MNFVCLVQFESYQYGSLAASIIHPINFFSIKTGQNVMSRNTTRLQQVVSCFEFATLLFN